LSEGGTPILLVGDSHADVVKSTFADAARDHGFSVDLTVTRDALTSSRYGGPWLRKIVDDRGFKIIAFDFSRRSISPEQLEAARVALQGSGARLVYVRDWPLYDERVPKRIWQNLHGGWPIPKQTLADNERLDAPLRTYLADHPEFAVLESARALCNPVCKIADAELRPLYFDADHLTLSGATHLKPMFDDAFRAGVFGTP
jgi:hypothetical protein